jgi:hypothetical protein
MLNSTGARDVLSSTGARDIGQSKASFAPAVHLPGAHLAEAARRGLRGADDLVRAITRTSHSVAAVGGTGYSPNSGLRGVDDGRQLAVVAREDAAPAAQQRQPARRLQRLRGLCRDESALSCVTFICCPYGDSPYKREPGGSNDGIPSSKSGGWNDGIPSSESGGVE